MAADDGPQQWRIKVHAKSRNFSLRIRATGTPPAASRPHDLTALLRLRGFILKVKSASAPTQPRRGGLLKSMFRRFFKRIRPPPTPTQKEAPAAGAALLSSLSRLKQLSTEEPVGIWSVFLAVFVLGAVAAIALKGAIKFNDGTFVPISLVLLSSSPLLLFKKYAMGTNKNGLRLILWSSLVIVIILVSFLCDAGKHFDFFENYVARYLWKALKLIL